jgi:proteasome alpha subunit
VFTPYDWQEGIGNRAQYIEGKLAQGSPVLAISLEVGILVLTYRRQSRKIFEIYDRIIYAGIGQQSDVEAIRMAALEFASKEAFNRSDEDVNVQRVATALSAPLKKAFSDFSSSPVVARSLFGEVGTTPAEDLYYILDYDGDYSTFRNNAIVSATGSETEDVRPKLEALRSATVEEALEALSAIWLTLADPGGEKGEEEVRRNLTSEAVLLERSDLRDNRFRLLTPEEF